jgi:hypothetical protein
LSKDVRRRTRSAENSDASVGLGRRGICYSREGIEEGCPVLCIRANGAHHHRALVGSGKVASVVALEGGTAPTRWWDRSVGTQMDWLGQTFIQEFVSARGSEDGGAARPIGELRCEVLGLLLRWRYDMQLG